MNAHRGTLVDRLAGQLVFERVAAWLYDALLARIELSGTESLEVSPGLLTRFRDEQEGHFRTLLRMIRDLGADPLEFTPSANDAVSVAGGVFRIANDGSGAVVPIVGALLGLKLADQERWRLLAKLAGEVGQGALVKKLRQVQAQQAIHVNLLRQFHEEMTLVELRS